MKFLIFVLIGLFIPFAQAEEKLEPYQKVNGISGNLSSVGSDTLASMMTLWVEEFNDIYPNINVQVQASGSSTATPALVEETAQFGPMSRPMRAREEEAFERQHGYKPTALRVAIDAIGIFVHKDNPIEGLNFTQIDSIFSSTLRCGSNESIENWKQLGIEQDWAKRRLQLFGRNSVSGTYGYFKQNALCGGDFKRNVNEQPGSASVVQSVASSINTIGYSGVGYLVSGVRLLPISENGGEYIAASRSNILSGVYPLSRFLYVYVNKHPTKPLSPLEAEFIRFIFSEEGQALVSKDGYVPISPEMAEQELEKVGL
ncbi:Phosphate ABC transporter, periplasmic phosphate-binding protein, PstS [Vibrio nigripulchritudo SFn27]|uniref:Phosphate-binding protein n=1 Tax=Vibrio nigripulchritudo TaxID=28173 RepID=U4JUR7_9VIBR|nr:phosphate ABC transporter substrate-binding protein PstS family protein [Vibrio nigripulchritudo]CCN83247.1 Phosphate ABC transporter, periplasmic phosphate-binding protein, PstS [Vibrio nigripulchritudo BLFn1]CCN88570.1 Phosphate ABC transporter, periplasmic phosphate-binding protein, PstS [Vibrio nigripulchritudo SFn27]CCN92708.1 Phosphate ABC transporter, periplasmic phosphate-binding protein, PstS [Vibrio nigripulchritudo ENn2]CCO40294.1 Phosphate ABC transporter, periplasmic phosphate-b